ncbi:unnamed protein product [Ceratitis capitata]|uniref:(Mediterranean fruit fly) hypothetical protein n=1 Tax=Ceratitis capitata TaxID=7213 RepID=A0A811V4D4_CERCA|nr:unnamed protein product [Ceratitis capitata]
MKPTKINESLLFEYTYILIFICFIFFSFHASLRHTHRRTKELTYNYVDRVRLAEHSLQQDYKCPSRGSGWRHNNKSISHLDLATSCHSTAFGPSHWPHNRQLRHSRSLDYAHLRDGCGKDPLDIAEFYWRLDPEVDALYEDDYEDELPDDEETVLTRYNNSEHHRQEQPYRDYNYVANNNQLLHPPHTHHNSGSSAGGSVSGVTSNSGKATTPASTATATLQAFDFGNESCSLRRSRSLAVIREETFSDLQITTTNNSRRSQLIPRARIVNRGFIRERERFICGSGGGGGANKHHHHHHHADGSSGNSANICEELDYEEGLNGVVEPNNNNSNNAVGSGEALDLNQRQHQHTHQRYHHHHHHASGGGNNSNHDNLQYQQKQQHHIHTELRLQSPAGGAQQAQQQQQQQQQHHHHSHNQQQSREADDYYDNLKRLDALTLGLVEQLHPWHNERAIWRSHELDLQQQQKQQQQQQLDFEALEEAVSFLANEKPRIYQSRRQQRGLSSSLQKLHNATDSYQENSQSSAFPETTTSNSDDQTDSPSLSEQEYDLKKIEKIYQKTTELEADEEGYELISLTTTTRTRIETTEDEGDEEQHLDNNFNCVEQRADEFDWSNPRTADIKNTKEGAPINGVLKRTRALSENLEKLIAYDSVYLSSEESSESILLDEHHCGAYERTTQLTAQLAEDCGGETATLLHFSIEDIIYELPHTQQQKQNDTCELKAIDEEVDIEQLTTVACTETILTETETETEVGTETVEIATQTAQEKQLVSIVETVNTKIEKKPLTATTLDENTLESTTLYTQILKVGHTPATNPSAEPTSTSTAGKSPVTANTATATGTTGILKAAAVNSTTTQPSVGITSSAASKPKILSVVEKRKWKRYSDTTNNNSELIGQPARGACGLEPIVCSPTTPQIDYPLSAQKRQLTAIDSLTYLPYPTPTQLIDNQYHSLPDVSIGQSLKVSESIDAKLRSSYNIAHGSELVECCKRVTTDSSTSTNINTSGATSTKAPLLVENANKCKLKQQQREEVVTCEEIYDSIKRFGRAHQKARQKEYQELHEVHVEKGKDKEKKRELKEYSVKASVASAIAELEGDVQAATTYPDSLAEEIDIEQAQTLEEGVQSSTVFVQNTSTETNEADDSDSNITTKSSLATSASEYQEQPKDAPNETVENFSKLIERRAQEIKAKAASSKRTFGADDQKHLQSLTQAGRDEGTKAQELLQQQADDYEISTTSSQFRIIVTDAQDNIIEEDAIEQNDDSLNSDDKSSAPLWETPKLNLLTDITIRRQEKREKSTKDKSTIVSTHTRVASLKRVPSKPKRQQHHHCCQQQHNKYNSNKVKGNNSNGSRNHATTNGSFNSTSNDCHDSNNYCELSIKSKEHRVLSTQIYKARPIKVLTANDSFRRRSTEGAVTAAGSKMSRPQILHVVDNKRRGLADILGTGKNVSNNTSNKHSSSKVVKAVESSQIESEYLKKVDAVRNYWAKLAKEGDAQQTECDAPGESGREGEDVQRTPPLADWQTLSCAHKQENVNELPRRKQTEVVQATQPTQQAQQQPQQPQKPKPEPRHFILGPQPQQAAQEQTHTPSQQRNYAHSPCKPVKPGAPIKMNSAIVELDGDKKATIVSAVPPNSEDATALANDANGEPQFDHIRYKVLKSQQLLRSNMEYSFQELLANNNVVIVEPVRTKIERPLTIAQAAANVAATKKLARSVNEGGANTTVPNYALASDSGDKMTEEQAKISPTKDTHNKQSGVVKAWQQKANRVAGAGASGAAGSSASGIKRHFFYQPVRVNRELYEEELPNPDIVRNVRRFFEENVLPTPRGGMQLQHMLPPADGDTFVERSAATQLPSPRARRARKYRYLTIDTSYGHMPPQHQHHHQQSHESHQSKQQLQAQHTVTKHGSPSARKWDTASLSSGISSGDLSSPCECNELDTNCAAAKMAAVNGETLKGIHVQAAVQRHNNRNMQHIDGATDGGADDSNGLLQLRPRPRPRSCGVVRASEDPTYRVSNVYERHASQQQQRNFTRDEADNRPGGEIAATDDEDADLDDEESP